MEFDFSRLRGRIVERYGSYTAFAESLGKSSVWISNRLNNVVHWSSDEIHEVCQPERLDIPPEEIHLFFYARKFRLTEQGRPV